MKARSLTITTQPTGTGAQQPASEAAHLIRKGEFDAAIAWLGALSHAPVTVSDTYSLALLLVSGTQQLTGNVRRKTASLGAGEGLIAETVNGLVVALGTGANEAASGSSVAALGTRVTALEAAVAADIAIADVTGLETALNGKSNTGHTHIIGDVSGLQDALNSKAPLSSTWDISSVNGLQAALDAKAAASHTHAIGDVAGLQTALDNKAAASHTHAVATSSVDGFMAAADKAKLDSLSATEFWLPPVATKADLPLNTDPVGAIRVVKGIGNGVPYRCIAQVGLVDDQWISMRGDAAKAAGTIGDGSNVNLSFSHNLDTTDVDVTVRYVSGTKAQVEVDWSVLNENTVSFSFGVAPSSGSMRVVVIG
jgi:hypothetical protein